MKRCTAAMFLTPCCRYIMGGGDLVPWRFQDTGTCYWERVWVGGGSGGWQQLIASMHSSSGGGYWGAAQWKWSVSETWGLPTCGLVPSFSPVACSLAARLVSCQPPPPDLNLEVLEWVLEPSQAIRGNKVGPSPTHPFLYPSNTLTLHTGTPLFSAGRVRHTVASNASKGPKQQAMEKKLTCTNSASSFLTLKINRKCFFLCFHLLPSFYFHRSLFLLTCHS